MNQTENYRINQVTLEEHVNHITPEFPYMANLCDLHFYPGNTFPWHWHNEVEFFYMREGKLEYHLPSGSYTFTKGEGGFINANVLHMTCCEDSLPCIQIEHIFLPQLIGGEERHILMRKYIHPIIENPDFDLFRFDSSKQNHQEIINILRDAYAIYIEKHEGYELDILSKMTLLWKSFFFLTQKQCSPKKLAFHSDRIKTMMEFIAAHYHEKLTLKQIADSSYISVRECCRCFQKTLGQSPFAYLIDYRLRKACNLLSHTQLSITEIGTACGFDSSSYFGKLFREKFGCTPKEYRRQSNHCTLSIHNRKNKEPTI